MTQKKTEPEAPIATVESDAATAIVPEDNPADDVQPEPEDDGDEDEEGDDEEEQAAAPDAAAAPAADPREAFERIADREKELGVLELQMNRDNERYKASKKRYEAGVVG